MPKIYKNITFWQWKFDHTLAHFAIILQILLEFGLIPGLKWICVKEIAMFSFTLGLDLASTEKLNSDIKIWVLFTLKVATKVPSPSKMDP